MLEVFDFCYVWLTNYDSTYRLKATEDSGDEESQSKDNQKAEKSPLVSRTETLLMMEVH